jgi:hypothetical protein
MVEIPDAVRAVINSEAPDRVSVMGISGGPDGYVQLSPRGSLMVFDDTHLAVWERGGDRPNGSKVSFYFRAKDSLKTAVPAGVVRFFGKTEAHRSGPIYEEVWARLISIEKGGDPEKKGYAVLVEIERAEDLLKNPLRKG